MAAAVARSAMSDEMNLLVAAADVMVYQTPLIFC